MTARKSAACRSERLQVQSRGNGRATESSSPCGLPTAVRYSILHLSDLHRDPHDEVQNGPLLDSIERDVARFEQEEPPITRPSICLVSGDLVYGVRPTAPDAEAELARQCEQARDFLENLAERLFAGDLNRIILVPGNHDVSYSCTMNSVVRVDTPEAPAEREALVAEYFAPKSTLRWSWSELCFYRIAQVARYEQRFGAFAGLYHAFYRGHRSFASSPDSQHAIFDYPDLHLCVLALNSCYDNDPLNRTAAFHPCCISEACRMLRDASRSGRLVAAVWHHSLFGPPHDNDYLDSGPLQNLIDAGVSLAFHGHQHQTECIDERYRLGPGMRKITLVGAGTLCAGPRALKPGIPRSYNVIEIDTDEWTGRLHQRQMLNGKFDLPIWGPGHIIAANTSHFPFSISPPLHDRPARLDVELALQRAESLVGSRNWAAALSALTPIKDLPLARLFLLKAAVELGDPRRTIELLWPPRSAAEAVCVGGALVHAGTREEAEAFVNLPLVVAATDASVREIEARVRGRHLR